MTNPTRDQVLAAAARLYGEHGFRGTTTRKIAEAAGVNEVTLFRQFGSKTALLLEALKASGLSDQNAFLPDSPADPVAELGAWCAHKRKSLGAMRAMIRKAMSEFEEHPDMPKCMTHGAAVTHAMLHAYLQRLAEGGFIRADSDIVTATTMLMSSVFQDAISRDLMPHGFPQPATAAPGRYAELCLRSLGYDGAMTGAATKQRAPGRRRAGLLAGLMLLFAPLAASAQSVQVAQGALSLGDALALGQKVSHTVKVAEAGVMRSEGQQMQARSAYLPQLNSTMSYQRTVQSQFQAISAKSSSGSSGSGSSSSSSGGIGDISKIFAAPNTVLMGLTVSQNLFTAGRLAAATQGAKSARSVAEIALDAARAQVNLDVAQAYFDAVAADALVQIADSTLAQTERTLSQTTVSKQVGTAAEFDLLRARVARDNQRPVLIQARGSRELALLRLRQLLNLPLDRPLQLTTPITDDGSASSAPTAGLVAPITIPGANRTLTPDTAVANRSSVRQAEANVTALEFALRAQNENKLPTLQLSSNYQRFAYPATGTLLPAAIDQYYPNWTVALGLSVPVFTGGRLNGDRKIAEANLIEARQTFAQTKELAALDARTALNTLEQAQGAYAASVGTDEQARRAYSIAEVRFNEGISTQVELLQSRTQYEQARLNRVLAARDLEVARLRVAFLKDLPVGSSTGAATSAGSRAQAGSTARPQ